MIVIGSSSFFSAMMAGTISGKVFQDYNGSGTYETSGTIENLFAGVTVTVYDSAGAVQGTTTTTAAADGNGNNYSITATGTGPYRVEFTNIPSYLKPGVFGTGAGTTVQFVPDNTTTATSFNLGLTDPNKFNNEANPETATTLFFNGQYNASGIAGNTSIMRTPYNATGHDFTGTTPTASFQGVELSEIQETGAIYGMAWQSTRNRIYAGAYHKRYSGFGANGPDAIYVFDKQGNTIGTIDLDTVLGTTNSAGADVHDFTVSGGIVYDIGASNASYDGVGKRSIGDIDISADQKTLFVVNLFDRRIYAINVASGTPSGATLIKSWSAPDATTANRHRPFALAYHQGQLWVGSVDENGSNAYIHSMTPNLSSPTASEPFTLRHTVALNYARQAYIGDANNASTLATWRTWSTNPATLTYLTSNGSQSGGGEIGYPQPILSDIEFDETGSMILGFRDRFGDQTGYDQRFRPSDTSNTLGTSAGDILRVCATGGSFATEGSAGCATSGGLVNSGPGGAASPEHYNWDLWSQGNYDTTSNTGGFHWETAQGALIQLAGRPTILTTSMDPVADFSGGFVRYTNSTGRREGINTDGATTAATVAANGGYTLFRAGNPFFAKANGLGDIEALTNPPPIEIGNRVWRDTNNNGRQDPGEAVLANVLVGLYDASGVLISTVETNAAGQYLFSSSTTATDVNADGDGTPEYDYGITALTPETNYTVAILNSNFSAGNPLAGLIRTQPNSAAAGSTTNNDAITDIRDSDGVILATGVGTGANAAGLGTAFTTGTVGSANHGFDFGFVSPVSIGSTVFNDANNNGIFDTGETGISGVLVELLFDANNNGVIDGTELTTPVASVNTSAVAGSVGNYFFNGLIPGNYQVRIPTPPTGLELSSVVTDTADNQEDNDDNGSQTLAGGATISPIISLLPDAEPTGETGQGGTQDDSDDNNGDMTIDFGFTVPTYSLGNRIWFDTNNDGQINSGEVGIGNVSLTLLDSSNNPVDNPNQAGTQDYTIVTDANGYYRFDNLPAGTYKVRVNATNFNAPDADTTDALVGYQNTTGNTAGDLDSTLTAGQNGEDGINPTGAANGVLTSGILTNVITLGSLGEPTGETDVQAAGQGTVDNLANMTVDFGFYRLNLSGTVWNDTGAGANNNNGQLDAAEAPIPGVAVLLYDSTGLEIPVGLDGILGTADDGPGGMLTNSSGNYNFQGLPSGVYRVGVNTSRTGTSSTFTAADTNLNVDSDDDGGTNPSFPQRVVSGLITLTPGGEPTVTQATGTTLNTTVDFGFIVAPTIVSLETFDVFSDNDGMVTVKWMTASEDDNLGFNVYREVGGKRELVNASPIIGTALRSRINLEAKSAGYSWTDVNPVDGAVYYLEDIDMKGTRTIHGPVTPVMRDSGSSRTSNPRLLSDLAALAGESKQSDSPAKAATASKSAKNAARNTGSRSQQSEVAARKGVKIAVKSEGWYRISISQLQNAGFELNSDPNNWQLFKDGEEIPFRFGADNAVEFYGHGLDLPETDKQTYYLTVGKTAGQRLPDEIVTEIAQPNAAASFRNTATIKGRTIYFPAILNGDKENWFGAIVSPGGSVNHNLVTYNPYQSGQAHLKIRLQGIGNVPHIVNLNFNNFNLGALTFEGYDNQTFEFDLPMSAILAGNNRITLTGVGSPSDYVAVDEINLTYERKFTARDNKLTFRVPAGNSVTVDGFSDANINVVELNNSRAVRRLAVQSEQTESGFALNLNAANYDREFIAVADSQAANPVSIIRNNPSRWNSASNKAQFVIITPDVFREAAENLARVRQQEGFQTQVVAVEDIFDEFSFGRTSVDAVKEFLKTTQDTWQTAPSFVLLFGDNSYDMRNYLAQPNRNLVPTKLIDTPSLQTSSDAWLADFDDDGIEDISIGRLPAGTESEAAQLVGKLTRPVQSENIRDERSNLFVADSGFDANADELRAALPAGVNSNVIRSSELGVPQTRSEIINQTGNGQSVITYFGHGSSIAWSNSGFFNTNDVAGLKNDKLAFYLLMTCLNGYAVDPGSDSLAESLIKAENGALAVWSSSGATHTAGQAEISRAATDLIFNRPNNPLRIGEIVRMSKAATQDNDIRRTWLLIGDPTMFVR